ncbi:unnamed protein product [Spirodela intermedia]|uniref:Uncharacterized protein n=1 Tax=Spirodela intermedia TaxID=51605 RepID=A0A7I8JCM9_SPIIN|nr:unnamed protein product [Spirodela intermedia]CAA6667152.1 unnamed protein product [Spirodela intermedia]
MSVSVGPGATQLAVMPVPASSFASTVTIASTAALDPTYAANPGFRCATIEEVTAIIRPPPPRGRRFAASRQQRKAPRVLTLNMWSKESSVVAARDG